MRRKVMFAALGFVALLVIGVGMIPVRMGGGQSDRSPNGEFVAEAFSLQYKNPIHLGRRDTFYEFTIRRAPGSPPIKKIVFEPSERNAEYYFRTLPPIISWSADSKEVTFTIPGATLKLDTAEHHQSIECSAEHETAQSSK